MLFLAQLHVWFILEKLNTKVRLYIFVVSGIDDDSYVLYKKELKSIAHLFLVARYSLHPMKTVMCYTKRN